MSEELFGIILLAGLLTVMLNTIVTTGSRVHSADRHIFHLSPRGLMSVRYRKHWILPTIDQDEATGAWFGSAHIQYTEKLIFHNVLIKGRGIFWTKAETEKHLIQEAKEWINSRLRSDTAYRYSSGRVESRFTGLSLMLVRPSAVA